MSWKRHARRLSFILFSGRHVEQPVVFEGRSMRIMDVCCSAEGGSPCIAQPVDDRIRVMVVTSSEATFGHGKSHAFPPAVVFRQNTIQHEEPAFSARLFLALAPLLPWGLSLHGSHNLIRIDGCPTYATKLGSLYTRTRPFVSLHILIFCDRSAAENCCHRFA